MEHRFYTKNIRSAILGLLNIIMVCCLTAVLVLNFATSAPQSVYADENAAFSNIVNANIGLHPKWIETLCTSAKAGGVGDTYTSKHKVWHADVTKAKSTGEKGEVVDGIGNDVILEKSPSYVFKGDETNAAELAKEYSLKKGNEVIFNITDQDTAAKVWADAVAFAQTLGTPTELADPSLAGTVSGDKKTSQSCTGAGVENHNGFRVGTNTNERNMYKGNFFISNSDGALGQYITVRLQTDWKARDIITTAPTDVSEEVTGQTVTNSNLWGASDYLTKVAGTSAAVETTSFNYVKNTKNTKNIFGAGLTYLPDANSPDGFTRIDSNDNDYIISWDLASNSCDYDGPQKDANKKQIYGYIYNDNCAFSYGRINVPTGVYIVLDLNGHTIDRKLTETTANYYGSVFHIGSKARLEIMDSSSYENASSARIEGTSAAGYNASDVHTSNHNGTIKGGYVKKAGTLNLPVTLQANLQSSGGGFNLSMWADLVIHSGTISNNKNDGSSGGAFYQRSKAAVTIYDGYVLDNEASGGGGGVTNLGSGSGCPFTMYGGVLAYNKASDNGGGVNLARSSYGNFHGGEIVNNEATNGGGIALDGNTLGILDSITITGNKANEAGGGVYVPTQVGAVDNVWRKQSNGSIDHAFKFRGSLQIYDNTVSGKANNVYLQYGTTSSGYLPGVTEGTDKLGQSYTGFPLIGIGGPLIANGIVARVGVTLSDYSHGTIFTSGYGKNGNSGVNTFLYFSSDNSDYAVVNNEDSTAREATLGQASSVNNDGGLTWVIEGTGTDADTDMSEGKGESTIKIVIPSEGDPDFYYKNPNNNHGLTTLKKVDGNSQMNKQVKLTTTPKEEDGTDKLLDVLKDRFTYSSGSLTFEYSMLKVTKISVYTGTPSFSASGDNLNASGSTPLRTWESKQTAGGDKPTYEVTNTFENANFRFKLGTKDLTATKEDVSGMQDAISATDGSISYAGEYSVLVSDGENRYNNPTFKIRINQVGVEVGRTLYYSGKKIGKDEELNWTKPWIDWNGDGERDEGNDVTKPNEIDQPYFVYSGDYYYPILNADYNSLQVFRLYNPYATEGDGYSSVAKSAFTGYVLDFTYANEYFGTKQPVQFGSHSGGGIQYQTMHRKPNSIAGTGTYVPGVKNAGMYEVTFISSRSAASADENDEDFKATGVYFAANNFAFSSKINIYVDPASAEVELTNEAKNDFTFNGRAFSDTEIVSYDNTSNTHVNPHFDTSAYLEYYEFNNLLFKAGIYDVRTKLYYTLDQVKTKEAWNNVRPYGSLDGVDDSEREKQAAAAGRPYISSYKDSELETPPVVLWASKEQFDPSNLEKYHITDKILDENELAAFEELYETPVDLTSTGKLVYIVDSSSFKKATKLEGNPTNARRYAVFVTLDLDVGYDDYNYNFDQNADHLMGLDKDTSYFWAFEFTVNPAQIVPYDYDMAAGDRPDGANTSVQIEKKHIYNGVSFGYDYLGSGKDGYTYYNDGDTGNNLYKDENSRLLIKGTFEGTDCYYSISPDDGSGVVQLHKHTTEKPYTVDVNATYTLKGGRFVDDGNSDVTDKIVLTVTDQQVLPTIVYTSEGQQVTLLKDVDYVVYYTAADFVNASVKYVEDGGNWTMETENTLPVTVYFGGSNRNYAYADDNGAMPFSVNFRIEPVIVTASASLSYAYDGSDWGRARYLPPRADRGAWYESIFFLVQDDITTPQELIEHQHDYGHTMSYTGAPDDKRTLDDLWGGVQTRNDIYYGDTDFYKGRYTLGGITVSYNDTGFIANGLQFGLGVYSFKTGNANATSMPYHLTPVALDGTEKDVGVAPTGTGVTWILTFGNTQYFNTGRDFVINMAESSLDVTITQKDINDNFGSITRFGDKTFDHVSNADGKKLTSSATGAVYPYAGDGWGYFPAVTFEYVPSFEVKTAEEATETKYYDFGEYYKSDLGGSKLKSNVLKTVQAGKEGSGGFNGLTLTYSNNTSATDTAAVRVIGSGNYTGTFILNFKIDPAKIKATYSKEEQPVFDKQTHAVGVTYSNVSSFGRGEGFAAYEVLNTNTEYGEDNKAILRKISDTATVSQYTENDVPLPGSAITVEYRASKEVYKVEEGWDTDAPVNAKTYDVRITVANLNYAFVDSDNFIRNSGYAGIEQTERDVYGTHTVLPAEVTVEVTNDNSMYNGEQQSAALSFANKLYSSGNSAYQYVVPEPSEYSITKYYLDGTGVYGGNYDSEEAPVHVGKYTITIQLNPTSVSVGVGSYKFSNYCFTLTHPGTEATFTAGTETTGTFEITKAEIRLGDLVSASYNGNAQQPALTFENSERGNDEIPVNSGSQIDDDKTFYTVGYTPFKTGVGNMKSGTEYFITDGKVPCFADTYNVDVTLVNYGARDFMFIGHSGDSKGQVITDDGKIIKDDFIITPALVLVTVEGNVSITYDALSHKCGVKFAPQTAKGVLPQDTDYAIIYKYNGWSSENIDKEISNEEDFKNAGKYSLTVKLTADGNFAFRQTGVGTYLYEDNSLSYRILAKNLNDMTLPEVGGTATDESMGEVVKLLKDYKFVMQDEDVTIKTASDGEVIFTGSAIEPVSGVLGLEKNADGSRQELVRGIDYTISYVEQINAGNAVVKITGGSHNYNGIIEIDYTISPKSLGNATYVKDGDGGVTFMGGQSNNDKEIKETSIDSIRDKTYTGNARAFAPSLLYKPATAIQVTLSENVDVGHFFCKQDGDKWVEAEAILEAGNYRAVVFALEKGKNNEGSAGNGSGNYTGNFVYDFEVTPAGLTVFLEGQDTVYDGKHHQYNVRFNSKHATPTAYNLTSEDGKTEGDKVIYEFTEYTLVYGYSSDVFNTQSWEFTNVGKYTVRIYIKSSNFTWDESQTTGSDEKGAYVELSYAITPVQISASAATPTFTFGNVARQSDVSFTNETNARIPTLQTKLLDGQNNKYESEEYTLVFDGGQLDGGAEPFNGYESDWFDGHDGFKNVGTYNVKVVLPEGGNFIFGGDLYETTYTYSITPAVLSIDPISATVYNGANQEPELKFSVVGEAVDNYKSLLIKDKTYQISISAANRYSVNNKFDYAKDDKPKNADVYTLTVKLGHIKDGKFVQDELKEGNFVFVDLTSSGTTSTMDAEYIINPFDFTQNLDSRITMAGLDEKGYTFTGSSISPEVTLTDTAVAEVGEDGKMVAGTDYIPAYSNNVNAAEKGKENAPTITFTGQGNYTGVRSLKFTIVAVSLGTNKRNAEGENYSFTYTDARGQQDQHVTSEANGNDSVLFGYEQLKSSYVYSASVRPATFTLFYNPAKGSDGIAPPRQSLGNGFDYVLSYYVFLEEKDGKEIWKKIEESDIKDVGRYLLFLDANDYEGAANKNYSGAYIIGFEITPAKVTVTFDGAQTDENGKLAFVYDGQPHNNTLVFLSCEDGEGGATPVSSDYRTETEYNGSTYGFDDSHNNSYVGAYKVIVYFVQGANGSVNFEWDTGYEGWNGELKQLKPEFEDENTKATLSFEIVPLEVEVRLDDSNTYYYTGASRDAGVEFPEDAVHPGNGDYKLEYYSAEEGQSETLEAIDAREYKVKFILTNKNFKLKKRENTGEESAADYYKFITDESGRNFVIKPAEISASLENSTVEYDGTGHTVKALFSNLVGSDKVPYPADYKITFRKGAEGDYGENELINAGVYSVKVTLLSTNYKFRIAEETLQDDYILEYIVTPKIISASLSSHQRFYDGKAHTPTTLFNILFAKGEESVELISGSDYSLEYYKGLVDKTSSVTEFRAAATYIVRVELTSGGNYAFSSLGDNRYVYINDLNYLIDARAFDTNTTVEVTFDKTDTFVYTGSPIEPKVVSVKVTFNSNEPESSETIVLAADEYNVAYNDNTNAGSAKIIVYGMNNYSGTVESEFTIRPKSLSDDDDEVKGIEIGTVSGSILDETYMGVAFNITPNISYTPKLFKYGAEGNITWWDGDTVILSNADFKLDKYQIQNGTEWNKVDTVINAGKYKAVYSGAGANYTDTIEIEFTIETALLYAELTSSSLDYTGGEHRLSDLIAFYNASDTNVTPATSTGNMYTVYTGEENALTVINANTYTVTVKVEGNNFKWVKESDKKYRDETLLNVTTDENGNAVFSFTVNKAKVGVTLSSKHANIYDGSNHRNYLSVSFANNINPTTVPNERDYDITWSNEGVFTAAGRYTVNIRLNSSDFCWYAQSGEDYNWAGSVVKDDTVTVVYTIEQAHLSASFNPDFTEYSGKAVKLADNLKLFNASGTTVIPSKSEYKVYSGDEATTTVTDAGEYIVTVKLNDKSNYIFDAASDVSDSIKITFTVRPMIINLDPFASQTYDGQTHEAQVSFVNQNGYRQEIDGYTVSYENNALLYEDKPLNAGRYTVKVTLNYKGNFGNWAFTQSNSGGVMQYTYETSGLFEIVKRDVTITVGNGHSIYGENLPDVASWGFEAEGLVTGAVIDNNDTKESLDIKLSYSPTIYPLTVAGEYSQSIFATAGVNTNPNYSIREINYGTFTMYARKVEIQILNGSSVYGTYRKGDVLPLVKDTHWRYTDVDNGEHFDILENDMSHLAFYLATCEPETKYAPVGTYDIVGTWGKDVTAGAAALKNYEITFVKGNGGAAGKFTVDPADIVSNQLADWNPAAKPFRNGEVGRYAMNFPVAEYIKLVGDYVLRTGDDNGYYTRMDFDGYYEEGETAYFKFVAFRGFYNEDDEGVVIKLYKPEFTGEAENASGYLADTANGVWKVYNVGEWKMKVEITQSNHNPLTCYLTYNIVPVDALVVLNPIIAPLTLEYGLEYLFPENPDGSFSQAQIAELLEIELNLKLFDYIFSSDNWMYSTVLSITGLDPLVGRDNMQGAYELLKANTRIEVTPATDGAGNFINYLSTSGRLNAGIYDIRIVAVEGCGFTAAFAAGGSNTGRLAITPHKLSVKWAEDEFEADDTQIVKVENGRIYYIYTGNGYSQSPAFDGIFSTDGVSDLIDTPAYEIRLPDGTAIENPRNVLELDGNYIVYVYDILEGKDSDNYRLPDVLQTYLQIVPRDITVTILDDTSIYGDCTDADIAAKLVEVERYTDISWLGAGDTVDTLNITLNKREGLNAGDYEITAKYDNINYNVTFVNGTYTVVPRPVTVTIGDVETTFGDEEPDLLKNYTAVGVIEGDTLKLRFEILGATYYDNYINGNLMGHYLEVCDDPAGYAIEGVDLDPNYDITFAGGRDGERASYVVHKAQNGWSQWFLFDYIIEGNLPFPLDLPIAYFGPTLVEYYYDEEMTQRIEAPLSELETGTYYARACVEETKNFTGLPFGNHTFEIVTGFLPRDRDFNILPLTILLAVEVAALVYGLIFVRRRKK